MVVNKINVKDALEKLIENYSLLRKNLVDLNLEHVKDYLEASEHKDLVYKQQDFKINFIVNQKNLSKEQGLNFLKILENWQKDKIKAIIWGGSAFSLLGGKDEVEDLHYNEAKDLDYILFFPGESERPFPKFYSESVYGFTYSAPLIAKMFESDNGEFLHQDYDLKFDFLGFKYVQTNELEKNFGKFFEDENILLYLPTKEYLACYFSYLEKNNVFGEGYIELMGIPHVLHTLRKFGRRAEKLLEL